MSDEDRNPMFYRKVQGNGTSEAPWLEARVAERICSNCKKRGNSCLRKFVGGDVDLGACVWCAQRGIGCSISKRSRGMRGVKSPQKKKKLDKGKGKEKDVLVLDTESSEVESEAGGGPRKRARVEPEPRSPSSSPPPNLDYLVRSPSPLFLPSLIPESPARVRMHPAITSVPPSMSPVFALTDSIRELSEVVKELWSEVKGIKKELKKVRKEVKKLVATKEEKGNEEWFGFEE